MTRPRYAQDNERRWRRTADHIAELARDTALAHAEALKGMGQREPQPGSSVSSPGSEPSPCSTPSRCSVISLHERRHDREDTP